MQPEFYQPPDPIAFMRQVWQDENVAPQIRVAAAVAALPFLESRLTQETLSSNPTDEERVEFAKEMVAYWQHHATPAERDELADVFDRILRHSRGETVTVERDGQLQTYRPWWKDNNT
jgi:hypothetical protein